MQQVKAQQLASTHKPHEENRHVLKKAKAK